MCGIVGFFDPDHRVDSALYDAVVGAMADRLAHRGPDDRGIWIDREPGIALGFRRLSILDLSPAGAQPMQSADGALVMVFNGEIYNHHELRRALAPHSWRGHSDSEVLIEAFARWGVAATLPRLNGMFAIGVWDRRVRRLFLARDRLGEKPLHYGWIGGVLLLTSELKACASHPAWTGEIDRDALGLFLSHGYVPAPWTVYAGMRKLDPGTFLEIAEGRREGACHSYWSAPSHAALAAANPFAGTIDDAADELQALIDDAVRLRMEADVPLGAFLSGGVDSSTVVAAMQAAHYGSTHSFCIGFPEGRYDESRYAAQVAHHLGTDHTTLSVSEAACLDVLPHVVRVYDEPFADMSQLPTMVLCQLAREHVTVSLSGDGGDELFCGYDRYGVAAAAWRRLDAWPRPLRGIADGTARILSGAEWRPARRLRRLAERHAHDGPESLYRDYMTTWRPGDGLSPVLQRGTSRLDAPLDAALPSLEQNLMLRDTMTYLPDDLLVKMDRASMACGLEVRAPLLDHRIAEFAWSLPPELAISEGGKAVLRAALYRRVPRTLVDRPKQGFEPPLARWLRGGLKDWADDLLSPERLRRHGIVTPSIITQRWSAHRSGRRNWARAIWPVLVLEAWLAEYDYESRPLPSLSPLSRAGRSA